MAKALMAAGYEAGDRIGMWSPNVAEWVSLLYGAARAGVILVNLNPAYRAHELTYVVEQCDMRGLVVACADARMDPPATARAVARESAPHLRQLIMLPAGSGEDAYAHVQDGDVAAGTPPIPWPRARGPPSWPGPRGSRTRTWPRARPPPGRRTP